LEGREGKGIKRQGDGGFGEIIKQGLAENVHSPDNKL
jgi:hypothetical protein